MFATNTIWEYELKVAANSKHFGKKHLEAVEYTIKHYIKKHERKEKVIPSVLDVHPVRESGRWYMVRAESREDIIKMEHNCSLASPSRQTYVDENLKSYKISEWVKEKGEAAVPRLIYSYYNLFGGNMKKRIVTIPNSGFWFVGYGSAPQKKNEDFDNADSEPTAFCYDKDALLPPLQEPPKLGNESPGGAHMPDLAAYNANLGMRPRKRVRFNGSDSSDDESLHSDSDGEEESESSSSSSKKKRQRSSRHSTVNSSDDEDGMVDFLVDSKRFSVHPHLIKQFAEAGVLPRSLLTVLK